MGSRPTLHDAFLHELRDAYDFERQRLKALKKLARLAASPRLGEAFAHQRSGTQGQVLRLEQAFEALGKKARATRCHGMAGIIDEMKGLLDESFADATRDACLIAAARRASHYEMAAYGTLVVWAHSLGHAQVAALLQQTLDEERAADAVLESLTGASLEATVAERAPKQKEKAPPRKGRPTTGRKKR